MHLGKIYYSFAKKICKMQGVYKMRLATFYWEMNKSCNEQVAGVDFLAKTLQKTTRSCRSYRTCSDLREKSDAKIQLFLKSS